MLANPLILLVVPRDGMGTILLTNRKVLIIKTLLIKIYPRTHDLMYQWMYLDVLEIILNELVTLIQC